MAAKMGYKSREPEKRPPAVVPPVRVVQPTLPPPAPPSPPVAPSPPPTPPAPATSPKRKGGVRELLRAIKKREDWAPQLADVVVKKLADLGAPSDILDDVKAGLIKAFAKTPSELNQADANVLMLARYVLSPAGIGRDVKTVAKSFSRYIKAWLTNTGTDVKGLDVPEGMSIYSAIKYAVKNKKWDRLLALVKNEAKPKGWRETLFGQREIERRRKITRKAERTIRRKLEKAAKRKKKAEQAVETAPAAAETAKGGGVPPIEIPASLLGGGGSEAAKNLTD